MLVKYAAITVLEKHPLQRLARAIYSITWFFKAAKKTENFQNGKFLLQFLFFKENIFYFFTKLISNNNKNRVFFRAICSLLLKDRMQRM